MNKDMKVSEYTEFGGCLRIKPTDLKECSIVAKNTCSEFRDLILNSGFIICCLCDLGPVTYLSES